MSLWIKICGNTSLGDALAAVAAGADAVGFVFAPSPRRVAAAEVAAIAPHLPATLEKIGVFVDAEVEEICSAVRSCGLTGVQLHSETGPELAAKLRERLGAELRILRVVHFGAGAAEQAAALAQDGNVDAVLVDSRTAAALGGTGVAFDWAEARKTVFAADGRLKLIVAGG
jgi:phosphoribosylanthranilate isomerase